MSSYETREPARCARSAGTDPARSRDSRVTRSPASVSSGVLAAPLGGRPAPVGGAERCRDGHASRQASDVVADQRARRRPTPPPRTGAGPRSGAASRPPPRLYNRADGRPGHLPARRPPSTSRSRSYAPGSPERAELQRRLAEMAGERIAIPLVIGGERVETGTTFEAVMPHDRAHVLADVAKGDAVAHRARDRRRARRARGAGRTTPWHERVAVFLRAAELLSGPWRSTLNAATMLNQSKTAHQAEIDAACETIDFLRFNAEYLVRIYEEQPISSPGVWNRLEYRPLEGFVFAISPFNFTAIGANLTTSPALMGNTVVWKPASTQALSAWYTLRAARGGGLPPGVINLVFGPGAELGDGRAHEPRARRRPLHGLDRRLPVDLAARSATASSGTATTRGSSERRAARTSSSRTPPPTRPRSRPRSSAARSSTRGRSARPPRGSTSRRTSGARSARASSADVPVDRDGRRARLHELHGRRDRRVVVRDPGRRRSPRPGRRARRSSPAAARTTARAGSSSRP